MAGWITATIVSLEQSEEVCEGCGERKMDLTLRIDANPPDGAEVGDVGTATQCLDRACPQSYIVLANRFGGLDG